MATKRVLLVSADPKFFEDPEHAFQSRGCDVFTAMTAAEAIEFLKANGAALSIFQGVPEDVTPRQVQSALGSGSLLIVADEGQDHAAFSKLDNVHALQQPLSGRELLKESIRLLDVSDRKYISILVQVRVTTPRVTTIFGKSRDLSEGGILVETNQMLAVHDKVVVSFLIPGADRMIQGDALVVREVVRPGGGRRYGLRFMGLADADISIIKEFVGGKLAQ